MGVLSRYRIGLRLDVEPLSTHYIAVKTCTVPQQKSGCIEKLEVILDITLGGGKFGCCGWKRAPFISGCMDKQRCNIPDR